MLYCIHQKTGISSEGIPVQIFEPLVIMVIAGDLQLNQINTLPFRSARKKTLKPVLDQIQDQDDGTRAE